MFEVFPLTHIIRINVQIEKYQMMQAHITDFECDIYSHRNGYFWPKKKYLKRIQTDITWKFRRRKVF